MPHVTNASSGAWLASHVNGGIDRCTHGLLLASSAAPKPRCASVISFAVLLTSFSPVSTSRSRNLASVVPVAGIAHNSDVDTQVWYEPRTLCRGSCAKLSH